MTTIEKSRLSGKIKLFLMDNPVDSFSVADICMAIEVNDNNKALIAPVLQELVRQGSVIVLQNNGKPVFAAGRITASNDTDSHEEPTNPPEEDDEEDSQSTQYELPPVPIKVSDAATSLDAAIMEWMNEHPNDHYRIGEVATAVCGKIGYKAPGDIGTRMRHLAATGRLYKAGHANNTRYQATPFKIDEPWMRPANSKGAEHIPIVDKPVTEKTSQHSLTLALEELRLKRAQLDEAIKALEIVIAMKIL